MDVVLRVFAATLWFVPPFIYLFLFKKAHMNFAWFFPALYPGAGLIILFAAIMRVGRAKRLNAISPGGFLKLQGLAFCPKCGKRINLKKRQTCRRCGETVNAYFCPNCGKSKFKYYVKDVNKAWGYLKMSLSFALLLNIGFAIFGYNIPDWLLVSGLTVMGLALLGAGLSVLTTLPSIKKKRVICISCGKDMPRSELLSYKLNN